MAQNLQCPFCGSDKTECFNAGSFASVPCQQCLAVGPLVRREKEGQDIEREAMGKWNVRYLGRAELKGVLGAGGGRGMTTVKELQEFIDGLVKSRDEQGIRTVQIDVDKAIEITELAKDTLTIGEASEHWTRFSVF